jgi:hypothetical protein
LLAENYASSLNVFHSYSLHLHGKRIVDFEVYAGLVLTRDRKADGNIHGLQFGGMIDSVIMEGTTKKFTVRSLDVRTLDINIAKDIQYDHFGHLAADGERRRKERKRNQGQL